ncbi:hypothetical protein [Cognatilysobacter lacus]|uniref:Uncharacterized protein n=1 Tax=Cognatilysobacter lacus TaxID=1643323 RepID=A0A5D8Z7B3_9GAMM|nr:hypothetical protein [Lysobacter lacus]TZF90671.1 hypothetical protein FW784_04465 [Lysobacter lacus]
MKLTSLFIAAAALGAAAPALAEVAQCDANYHQEGSFLSGRRFTTYGDVQVPAAKVFKTLYAEVLKTGFRVAASDKEMGTINAEQLTNDGAQQVTIPWNIVVEARKDGGSRITVVKSTPPGYATSEKAQHTMMCSVIDSAKK